VLTDGGGWGGEAEEVSARRAPFNSGIQNQQGYRRRVLSQETRSGMSEPVMVENPDWPRPFGRLHT
jgi:hypothetical protein